MWTKDWRNEVWEKLDQPWDVLIIGGGITGAGILREATRVGLKALLVEQKDFAWGTSSRSSKLVHGGLRYLKEGKVLLTRASVRERKRLIAEGPGLIDPLGFLLATYKGDFPGKLTYRAGLTVYDLLALQWSHTRYSPEDFQLLAPHIVANGLEGGFRYGDAQTDDARLVLRVILEAVADGGTALNYTRAVSLVREGDEVVGAVLQDMVQDRHTEVRAKVVINATGAWADTLRAEVSAPPRIRPLRGSHLIFPAWRFPVSQAISFLHPLDRRPVFIFPWEGITLVGTTDLDHEQPLNEEPRITPEEVAYLMAAVEAQCPRLNLTLDDIIGTFAGVRPVIGSGKADPSKESRDHVVWNEAGLLTVTGGKLTTFRLIALDALKAARARLPGMPELKSDIHVLDKVNVPLPGAEHLDPAQQRRLLGRYGAQAPALVRAAHPGELVPIPGTQTLWAELRWAARAEGVIHLDDLLLRRTRLGLLLPEGAAALLPEIRRICQPELGWDDARWDAECAAYLELWQRAYSLPDRSAIPDWKVAVAQAKAARAQAIPRRRKRIAVGTGLTAGLLCLAATIILVYFRRWRTDPTSSPLTAEPKAFAR
ncbi:MAG TPA: glycerol-3-phosphate dehydrogenase/oxidase [Anaerolineae bacterium]|nr:glycerol-3-phosphate dehydrogenase/oxidase [Anaerolineae bacterium]HQK15557.1 glycerol-3-phosphate dehydrogenase/oxidase [Anaerolineae bacterium]